MAEALLLEGVDPLFALEPPVAVPEAVPEDVPEVVVVPFTGGSHMTE